MTSPKSRWLCSWLGDPFGRRIVLLSLAVVLTARVAVAETACPAAASVTVFANNHSRDADVVIVLEGELRDAGHTCDGAGETSYSAMLVCHGQGEVRCGTIADLRPGAWIHRLSTAVGDSLPQRQTQATVVLAGDGASNALTWDLYARTFTVAAASEDELRRQLDEAAAYADATGERALVLFDHDIFPGSAEPRTIDLSRRLCARDGRHAGLCLTGSNILVDALDDRGEPGAVILSVGTRAAQVARIYGELNVLRGLVFAGSTSSTLTAQADTVAFAGPAALANRLENCIVRGPAVGDGISVETGAGTLYGAENVIVDSEITGAAGVGLKVTTGARAAVRRSCLHGNRNGGALATLGGRLAAIENLVQHNAPGKAPSGLAVGSSGEHGARSTLVTAGNIIRFNGARGVSVTDAADAVLVDDYVTDNQFVGARVETTTPGAAPLASFEGVALVCNHNDGLSGTCEPSLDPAGTPCLTDADCCGIGAGCCVGDDGCAMPVRCASRAPQGFGVVLARCDGCELAIVELGNPGGLGGNAFTLNNNTYPNSLGVNLLQGLPGLTVARGNQWERCGSGASCDLAAVAAGDVRLADGADIDLGNASAARADVPLITDVSVGRPRAGEVVRIFGRGFNAIDGAACSRARAPVNACSAENPRVVRQNLSRYGNLVQITIAGQTSTVDVDAVTPTMLAFRMPFDCFAAATLKVSRRDARDIRRTTSIAFCDPGGCHDREAGAPCDDSSVCTVEDLCSADGRCQSGVPLECGGQCMRCDPVAGCLPRSSDDPCDDGNACTAGDHCSGDGDECVPGGPLACSGACQSGVCDPAVGCEPAPPTVPCNDGNACTINDHCRGDSDGCVGGGALSCVGQCLTEQCNPATGCRPKSASVLCNDGDACTGRDHCRGDANVCIAGPVPTCDDLDPCTVDSCASPTGCQHIPVVHYDAVRCRLDRLRAWIVGPPAVSGAVGRGMAKLMDRAIRQIEEARAAEVRDDAKIERRRLSSARSGVRRLIRRLDRPRGLPQGLPEKMQPVAGEVLARIEELRAATVRGAVTVVAAAER